MKSFFMKFAITCLFVCVLSFMAMLGGMFTGNETLPGYAAFTMCGSMGLAMLALMIDVFIIDPFR